jgi:hypothetical protein
VGLLRLPPYEKGRPVIDWSAFFTFGVMLKTAADINL